jgi:N-acyl-D-amino-acid deacylase
VDAREAARRLQPAGAIYFTMAEADVRAALAHPGAMIGSDGLPFDAHPHPRLWGTFPRVLGYYSRHLGLFDLETAVHKMTGRTAELFGMVDRGVIRTGAFADLVLFDPHTVVDRATFDQPTIPSQGIEQVWTNGVATYVGGSGMTGAAPGRLIRRNRG